MTERRNMQDPSISSWHLDKRVPIALILGMIGQVAVVVWGAAVMFKDTLRAIERLNLPLDEPIPRPEPKK